MGIRYLLTLEYEKSSETESEVIPLRVVSQTQTQVESEQPLLTPTNTCNSQQSAPQEKLKQKRQKHHKSKKGNKGDTKKQETSSGIESFRFGIMGIYYFGNAQWNALIICCANNCGRHATTNANNT